MRRDCLFSILLAVGCVLFLQIGCQDQAKTAEGPTAGPTKPDESLVGPPAKVEIAAKSDKPSPGIMFETVVHDFRQIGPGTKHTAGFKSTNTGEDVLKITKIERCCGIVSTSDKSQYAPGESGVLKVEYTATSLPGVIRKNLYVNTNDKTKPRFELTVKASIVRKVAWEPDRLKLVLNEENAGCPEISLSSIDNRAFSITGFTSTINAITADVDPAVEATKFVLQPKVDVEKLQRTMRGTVNISLTHPECNKATIIFDALPRCTIKPPLLIAFYADPQEPIKRVLWILNNYGEDFEVESTEQSACA